MKEKNTDELKIDIPEDRGTLDLTRQIDELRQTIKGYEFLLDVLKKEIFEAKFAHGYLPKSWGQLSQHIEQRR